MMSALPKGSSFLHTQNEKQIIVWNDQANCAYEQRKEGNRSGSPAEGRHVACFMKISLRISKVDSTGTTTASDKISWKYYT